MITTSLVEHTWTTALGWRWVPLAVGVTWCLASVGVATGVVVDLMMREHHTVRSQAELADLRYGWPVDWVSQDQRVDPSWPHTSCFASPWEHPTDVDVGAFGMDVALVSLLLIGAGAGVTCARRYRRGGATAH